MTAPEKWDNFTLMKLAQILLILVGSGLTLSCASYFKRKDCEKTNWFQYGHDVAMSGRRLDADTFVKECRKVEAQMSFSDLDTGFKAGMAKYCNNDNVYEVGKSGKPFSYDMCDGENMTKMKQRWAAGIRVFCTPSSAYRFGAGGGVYLNVCPKDTEDAWMAEYRKGRKIYLTSQIAEKEKEISRLDGEVSRLESKRTSLSQEQAMVANQTQFRTERVYDPKTGSYTERTIREQPQGAQMRSQQLSSDISSVNYQIESTRKKQRDLQEEISKMRTEVVAL